jgi:hypothetical protein
LENNMDSKRTSRPSREPEADPELFRPEIPVTSDPSPIGNPTAEEDGPADRLDPSANGTGSGHTRDLDGAGPEADPFSLASLRLTQNFTSAVGVKKLVTTIPVKKPSREWFVRTHPEPAYRLQTAVLELKEEREVYLVAPALRAELASEPTFSPRLLVTTINRQGVLFLWPIRLPGPDGRVDDWSRSALDAAEESRRRWVRITANMGLGAYDVAVASGQMAEPEWPSLSFQEIIRIAFRDKMISDWDHPILRRLRGEV